MTHQDDLLDFLLDHASWFGARDTDNCNLLGMARIVCDKLEALEDTSTC